MFKDPTIQLLTLAGAVPAAFVVVVLIASAPDPEESNRLVGALAFIEGQIEGSSSDILDANPFISPIIDSASDTASSANAFRVVGRVKLLSRDADSGRERSHVEPYQAIVESLCESYMLNRCWRLHALSIKDRAIKRASASEDAEPIEAARVEGQLDEEPDAGSSAVAVTVPIETAKAERPATAESEATAPHESEFIAALPTWPDEWPFGIVPSANSSSAGRVADTALPAAPEPPQPTGEEPVELAAQGSSSPQARTARDRDQPSEPQAAPLTGALEPATPSGEPARVREIEKSIAKLADPSAPEAADEHQARPPSDHALIASDHAPPPSLGDAEKAAAVERPDRLAEEQAAQPERPSAAKSAAARQTERRRVVAEALPKHSSAPTDIVSDMSHSASNLPAEDSEQAAQQPAATEGPQDTAIAEPDAAPPERVPTVSFPEVTPDRLVARADDRPIPLETPDTVGSAGQTRTTTASETPPPGPRPDRPDGPGLRGAMAIVAAIANSLERQRATERQQAPESPLSETELRELEQGLARLGFHPGPIDGALDGRSEEAIRAYQDFAALPNTGRPNRILLAEVRQLAETVTLLAGNRDRELAMSGDADKHTAAEDETLRSITAAQPELVHASRAATTLPAQPLPGAPLQKPERVSPPVGQSTVAENPRRATPNIVASLGAKPVNAKPEPPLPRPTPVALTVDSLPREIRKAIEAGTVDARLDSGHTPLTAAIVEGRQDAVATLLDHGANPNLSTEDDATALMYAAWGGDVQSVNLLLQAGAEPNQKNLDGKTALMAASATGQSGIVKLLLESGADPNLQALKGWTALMYAVWRDQPEVVRLLLKHRANILLRNSDDETAVEIAAERARPDIHALLVNSSGSS